MPRRLMCVVAHPDDECFAFGGALALAKRAGFETCVICLTDGQAATNRGTSTDCADLGRMRRDEFARSCAKLGVDTHELLDYQDGTLDTVPVREAAGKIVERIRTWRPQILLTFGADGSANVHPDHTMVSCFTSAAFHWAGQAKRYPEQNLQPFVPQRLYHQSTEFTLPERAPQLPAPWSVELDIRSVWPLKEAAIREHTSQIAVLDQVRPFLDSFSSREHYILVGTSHPQQAVITTSLFDGIDA